MLQILIERRSENRGIFNQELRYTTNDLFKDPFVAMLLNRKELIFEPI
jgi:hypothetical protein